ncbi:MAG: hypothetical protein CVT67_03865 [Actinobacteria bacterium HGW-Actinobacteria-7]|nr:MAG: hypothetical protein CVT67_03865 [Actinobacteria bacterium HGW-Actinobacteria-7]
MKYLARTAAAALFATFLIALPAQAFASVTAMSMTTNSTLSAATSAPKVVFSSTLPKASRLKVYIYRGSRRIRTLTSTTISTKPSVTWNGKTAAGTLVAPGSYTYRAVATVFGARSAKRGRVQIPAPIPVVTPVPAPAPAPTPSRWFGFYQSGAPASIDPLLSLEAQLAARSAVVNFFIADSEKFPLSRVQTIVDHGSIPLVTLEFWSIDGTGGLKSIANGSKDAYLRTFADSAKSFGHEVWLRPFHEMNGNWYPWGGTVNGNSAADLIAAWRHVRTVFAERGATNVKFVWCVNNDNVPNTSANTIEGYWPGDAYVDYASLDGYNWGTTQDWSNWRSFSSVFGNAYGRVAALTAKPMFIAETASPEQGGSKAAWITDMFKQINTTYTRIQGVVWFNTNKECDWRIESSSTSQAAYKAAVAAGY